MEYIVGFAAGIILMGLIWAYSRHEYCSPVEDFEEVPAKTKLPENSGPTEEERNAALQLELEQRLAADTERWVVEIEDNKMGVFRTEPFEPYGQYCRTRKRWDSCEWYDHKTYESSKELAQRMIRNSQYDTSELVKIGDDYICRKAIRGVKLVKVK